MIWAIISTLLLFFILVFLIIMVYKIRSISKGPPSWIINLFIFGVSICVMLTFIGVFAMHFPQKGKKFPSNIQLSLNRLKYSRRLFELMFTLHIYVHISVRKTYPQNWTQQSTRCSCQMFLAIMLCSPSCCLRPCCTSWWTSTCCGPGSWWASGTPSSTSL